MDQTAEFLSVVLSYLRNVQTAAVRFPDFVHLPFSQQFDICDQRRYRRLRKSA